MTDRATRKLNFSRKLLLWTAACLAVALPIVCGLFNATPTHADALVGNTPKFSSVSIKPHVSDGNSPIMSKMMMSPEKGLKAINAPLHSLLQLAYHVQNTQLVGEPDWFKSQRYDIEAKVDSATAEQLRALPEEQLGLVSQHMLQQLLIDSFKVTLHQESRDLSVYELVVGDGGSKLQKAGKHGAMQMGVGELNSQGTPLDLFTAFLSQRLGKTVVDKTGLQGNYAFSLRWKPDADEMDRIRTALPPTDPNMDQSTSTSDAPPLLTALQEQLGLKLQPQTERVQVLVIDHVEQPAQD